MSFRGFRASDRLSCFSNHFVTIETECFLSHKTKTLYLRRSNSGDWTFFFLKGVGGLKSCKKSGKTVILKIIRVLYIIKTVVYSSSIMICSNFWGGKTIVYFLS